MYGTEPQGDVWGGPAAQVFRADPHPSLGANLTIIASYLQPQDTFIDIGGGAGRVSLPMAKHCREVVIVEPSAGMAAEFHAIATENQISNASVIASSWLEAEGIHGDVVFTAGVTYFMRDIEGFIKNIGLRAKRRAMITVWSQPPPTRAPRYIA